MRNVFLAFVLLAVGSQAAAFSGINATMLRTGCYTTVATSSGTAYKGTNELDCKCSDEYAAGAITVQVTTGYCSTAPMWYDAGMTLEGKHCCAKMGGREADTQSIETSLQDLREAKLKEVYQPEGQELLTIGYAGYLNSVLKSPSGGRANGAAAGLDICLGQTIVTGLGTGSTGYLNCVNSCGNGDNGYCTNTTYNNGSQQAAGACVDRCECLFSMGGTCEGL